MICIAKENMLALITGADGFVGKHLLNHLTECGDKTITTDISTGGPDLLDPNAFLDLFQSVRPDVVYHLAGQADVKESWENPLRTFRINAEGTLNVLEAAKSAGVRKVLCISSSEVYGLVQESDLPINELHRLSPSNPYATSKATAELISAQYDSPSLEVVIARSFNHFGPGQSENFVTTALAKRMLLADASGSTEITVGNLSTRRDFTDVRDVVRAYRDLILSGEAGEAYNVCSGRDMMIYDLANALLKHINSDLALVPDPDLQRPSDIPALRGDNSKLRDRTNWRPLKEFDESIADIVLATKKSLNFPK